MKGISVGVCQPVSRTADTNQYRLTF